MQSDIATELIQFIKTSPSAFHAVDTMKKEFLANGFTALAENERWNLKAGGQYFVTRNDSSIIAFSIPQNGFNGMRIMASHSDSPSFKIKENPEMEVKKHYIKLNVERYGGMIFAPWFDRDLVMIPNLAIHMNREVNSGYKYNAQKDMLPLYGMSTAKDTFMETVAGAAHVSTDDILGHDLFLYNRESARIWGADEEFISAPQLDDLQCAFSSMKGFLYGEKNNYLALHCVFDNEEVGSGTKQGAASTFLRDTLQRIHEVLGYDCEDYRIHLANSLMFSADNAHAVHPNHTDMADPTNRPYLNGGIVLKFNANQKYCTDAVSAAMFRDICNQADVPVQTFTNRSDIAGGSTLGNISNTQVALNTVDIGLPQLAMHSPYETAGVKDTEYLVRAAQEFFC